MFRRAMTGMVAVLVVFHVWLLAGHAWSGDLFEPRRLAGWLIAAGLAMAAVRLRRRSISIFSGRKAVVVWLLVALLHGPAVAQRFEGSGDWSLQQIVATLVQVTVVTSAVLLSVLGWLLLSRRAHTSFRGLQFRRHFARPWRVGPDSFVLAAPRPPPSA
jgi:hypothetical protein